ncbi:hypothetical protein NEOLEDRAFT_1179664 [Neolentinus lepideus HHB14362 ss-1]|uniref:Uncharacterized protein n=1 Tax=Neolentinus lepideus HHB14362 ss-1 TaxID=1314782 RepID=A0A165RJQ6_9AGAM|nr:hypothetical protein NEOLEDRAFT_1179664 [Neolentinus lepideus HHB14362 ss-1]
MACVTPSARSARTVASPQVSNPTTLSLAFERSIFHATDSILHHIDISASTTLTKVSRPTSLNPNAPPCTLSSTHKTSEIMNLFYLFRMSCMALTSFTCASSILASIAVSSHIHPKSYIWMPICIPALTFIPAFWALVHPLVRPTQSQHVAAELLWTILAIPFDTSVAIFVSGIYPANANPTTNRIFLCLQILTWLIFGVVTAYATVLASLSILTRLTIDKDIWLRDVTCTPSPFPVGYIIRALRDPSLVDRDYHDFWTSETRDDLHRPYCTPGCACSRKVADTESPAPCLDKTAADFNRTSEVAPIGESRREVPVRLPTVAEMLSSIPIGLTVRL